MKNFLRSIILTLFCVALFLFPHLLSAQWGRTDGPEEVNGTCLLYHNQRLWGGTWGGLYYSDDLAEHWHFVPAVKAPESVTSMVEWHDSLFVLAETPRATDDSIEVKLYFSPDNGLNWFKQANLPYIISDAYEPVQLFKSADRLILRSSYKTLMASDDGGISWHFIFILGNVYQYEIREDVILGLGKEGLFRSINGGRTWDKVVGSSFDFSSILAFDQQRFIMEGSGQFLPYLSLDVGQNWNLMPNVSIYYKFGFLGKDSIWFNNGQLQISSDNGMSWKIWDDWGPSYKYPNIKIGNNAFNWFSDHTLKKFDPVSKGWVNKNLGFRGSFVNHLSGDESVLFARADSSFFKSTDGGKNWDKYPLHSNLYSPVFQTSYYVLEDTIYISTQNAVLKAPVNNAIKWDTLAAFPNGSIVDFHLSENAFLLVVYPSPGLILLDPKLGVVTSVPYTFNSLYYYNQFNQMDGHLVFIAKHGDLWHSQDMGQTWTEPIMSLNPSAQHYQRLFKTDKRFYYNNNDKLFLSEDKGRSWIQLPANGLPKSIFNTRQVLQDLVQADSLLFAAIPGKGVFVSHDWGYNWQLYMDGLDENWVYALAWHKKQLFAGTFYNSVWRSILELLSVGDAAGKDADLQFSPNPARDRIVIQWSDLKGGTLQIFDARAQLVLEQKVADGLGILEVSVGNLPAGTYTMQLVRKGAILSGQAVIVR